MRRLPVLVLVSLAAACSVPPTRATPANKGITADANTDASVNPPVAGDEEGTGRSPDEVELEEIVKTIEAQISNAPSVETVEPSAPVTPDPVPPVATVPTPTPSVPAPVSPVPSPAPQAEVLSFRAVETTLLKDCALCHTDTR